MNVIIKL